MNTKPFDRFTVRQHAAEVIAAIHEKREISAETQEWLLNELSNYDGQMVTDEIYEAGRMQDGVG